MTVAVIGNSHAAVIAKAWNEVAQQTPDVSLEFFAATRHGVEDGIHVVGSKIPSSGRAGSEAGLSGDVDLTSFEAILVAGLRRDVSSLVRLHRTYQPESHRSNTAKKKLVSDALFLEMARADRERSLAVTLARDIRGSVDVPILLIPHPYPSLTAVANQSALWAEIHETGDAARLMALFEMVNDELTTEFSVIAQPSDTLVAPLFTDPRYTHDSGFFRDPDRPSLGPEDYHMNVEFGHIQLSLVLERLRMVSRVA
ncbi:MAG: hypothetical protein JJD92_12595 [Frankiaceae bacterium]|nr:hypothetical protein [Frankiaceae bacterium]